MDVFVLRSAVGTTGGIPGNITAGLRLGAAVQGWFGSLEVAEVQMWAVCHCSCRFCCHRLVAQLVVGRGSQPTRRYTSYCLLAAPTAQAVLSGYSQRFVC